MWKWILLLCVALSVPLQGEVRVLALAGSTRKDSVNQKLLLEAVAVARHHNANITLIDLKEFPLPFYNQDLEAERGIPENAKKLRQLMKQSDLILIASPEYNGSLSALLKNVIDWSSRSEEGGASRDAFVGKKFIIMSASPGANGGARGLDHVRTILENVGGTVVTEQITLGDAYNAFDDKGQLKNPEIKRKLEKIIGSEI